MRGPTNVERQAGVFTARQYEIYKCCNYVRENYSLVNIYGQAGIGKTRFVKEIAYYMNCRYRFFSGIYYLDLGQVKSTDEFKELLQKENLTFRNSDTLLILDDVYNMFKHNHSQFRWWIIDIITRYQVTILITSRNSVLEHLEDDHLMMKDIELSPLNMIESVELLLSTCKKQITLDDMGIYSD